MKITFNLFNPYNPDDPRFDERDREASDSRNWVQNNFPNTWSWVTGDPDSVEATATMIRSEVFDKDRGVYATTFETEGLEVMLLGKFTSEGFEAITPDDSLPCGCS